MENLGITLPFETEKDTRKAAMKKVLITGITGFVRSHLADYCLERGHTVYGLRRYHLSNLRNVTHIEHQVKWCDCDMLDMKATMVAIDKISRFVRMKFSCVQ